MAEGLEDFFDREEKTWDDLKPQEWIWIYMKREGRWYKYHLQVVKGMKCWSKKKGRTMGFPRILFEELRMVDNWCATLRKVRFSF